MWCLLQYLDLHLLMFLKVSQQLVRLSLSFNKSVAYLHLFPFFLPVPPFITTKSGKENPLKMEHGYRKPCGCFLRCSRSPVMLAAVLFQPPGCGCGWGSEQMWAEGVKWPLAENNGRRGCWQEGRRGCYQMGMCRRRTVWRSSFPACGLHVPMQITCRGNKLDPYQLLTGRCFLQKAGRCPPIWLGKIQL